jgi:hypothetical protein
MTDQENKEELFNRAGQPWHREEEQQLIHEYTIQKYDIMTISKLHKRRPGGILSRLRSCNIIETSEEARGYQLFLDSALFQEDKTKREKKREQKREERLQQREKRLNEKQEISKIQFQTNQVFIINEIQTIKTSIHELKQSVQEIKAMLEAVYEFE